MSSKEETDRLVKSRVEQVKRNKKLDALELDQEILHVLKNQLRNVIKYLPLSFQNSWEPEVETFLRIIILHLSLKGAGATFGQQLLKIEFLKSQRKTAFIAVCVPILLKYLQTRAKDFASCTRNERIKEIVDKTVQWGELSVTLGSLINLLLFLHSGYFPNLLYRVFGIEMAYTSIKSRQRQVGYAHMTRELIWHSFIELLVFVLPLINYHYIKRQVLKFLMLGASQSKSSRSLKKLNLTVNSKCAVCSQRPILPHHMDCDHVFCFYCLQANIIADPQFPCPQCGKIAMGMSSVQRVYMTVM